MKIIIIGIGKIGSTLVKHISNEGHEVVVIDSNPDAIQYCVDHYDVMGITGSGVSYEILKSAGVDKTDLVISVTDSDEANILACLIARKLGAKDAIARVRDYEYNKQIHLMREDLGINATINPELEAAREILRIINFPEAIRVDTFAHGAVDLAELYIPEDSPLDGLTLIEISKKYAVKALICAVQRGDDVFIPTGSSVLRAKDKIHITADRQNSRILTEKLGFAESRIRNIMIIGGGKIALYLGENLIKNRFSVKIIESDKKRCEELSELLPNASIIHADGSDQHVLNEEGLEQTDAVICLTGLDEENIIISMYAARQNVRKVITKINKASFGDLLESIEMASVVNPKEITASQIVSYVRATSNSRGNNIKTLYKLVNNKVEALEFRASESSKVIDIKLKDIKLKPKILIAGIIRNGEVIIPNGLSMINANDSVIVITTENTLNDLDDILE